MASHPAMITCPTPETGHLDKFGFLFGYPIAHSLSPLFHHTVFQELGLNWDYFPLPSTDIANFLQLVRNPRCYGKPDTHPPSESCRTVAKHLFQARA